MAAPWPDLGAYERPHCNSPLALFSPNPVVICQPDSVLISATGGGGKYYWNAGAVHATAFWAKAGGTYHIITTQDTLGCRAKTTFSVTAYPKLNPTITKTGNTLSVPAIYATYQWYKGGVIISGATAATFNPSANSLYKVVVTNSAGCKDSATYNLTNLSVSPSGIAAGIKIYPNPAHDILNIDDALNAVTASTIYDLQGRAIMQTAITASPARLSVIALPPATYLLRLTLKDGSTHSQLFSRQE